MGALFKMLADQHKQQTCHISKRKAQARQHCAPPADKHQTAAASCFAGKLYLNATGWSQAVLGLIGQCRTDTSAPFSDYEVLTSSIEYMSGPGPSLAARPSSILPFTKAF